MTSARRSARGAARAEATATGLPPDLAMGPCIEVWARKFTGQAHDHAPDWFRAKRAWEQAVDVWAAQTGFGSEKVPAANARNLARTHHYWSRQELMAAREFDWLDYLEGRGPEPSGSPPWFRFFG